MNRLFDYEGLNLGEIRAFKYPKAREENGLLHRIICDNSVTKDKGALMTKWDCFKVEEFVKIAEYAQSLVDRPTELVDLWGQVYQEGHFQKFHNHIHNDWAFVYYVNTPTGSSPIVFREIRKRIRPTEGMLIMFPGWVDHYVPPNQCNGRSIVAGNLVYS
tara:strand:+ start:605 stop:1084 length:480 start_codon:yes stop_codon:yes gene_type:complete